MKNANFTLYNGFELQLSISVNNEYKLIFRGANCPFGNFLKYSDEVYVLPIEQAEISNAYLVETFALYKKFNFQVDRFEDGKYRLTSSENEAFEKLQLHMVDRGWYDIWVAPEEIERMWEERTPTGLEFPFPEGLEKEQEVSFK